ncbi:MAG TPA: exodeoxyribonuclease VII large subunit, partial [Rhabdochlamydiaceae bacterium]|nr:exodeoxyribonuclease VII large subunit [Rhabdochlamydiaceae bacterium]
MTVQTQVFSVTELTLAIKKQIETRFPAVQVQGEITNFKEQASGHLYFTLKDSQSQISAVLF